MTDKVKIKDITINEQPRKDLSLVASLADSIKERGLLQPVAVRLYGADKIILVDGEQRLRACMKLGMDEIDVHFVKADDQTAKEDQLIANIMRKALSLIETMRGFQMLLTNAPAKYNELVIANLFGMKEKEVKAMVKLASLISPAVDVSLSSGHYSIESIEDLSRVPMRYQAQVVKTANNNSFDIARGIDINTEELYFDDIFTMEQARATGNLHLKGKYDKDAWYTFDKEFARKTKKEFELRTKKKHDEELAKEKNKNEKQRELTVEQKKKKIEKEKRENEWNLAEFKNAVTDAMNGKPDEEDIQRILKDNLRRLNGEHFRILLRAFKVQFKTTESSTDDMRKLAHKHVFTGVKTAQQLVAVIILIDTASYGTNSKTWAKDIRQAI